MNLGVFGTNRGDRVHNQDDCIMKGSIMRGLILLVKSN